MPNRVIIDATGNRWTAKEHSERYRIKGPTNQNESRKRNAFFQNKVAECYLGEPRTKTKTGQFRGGTRINIKLGNTWWHITKGDQPQRKGIRPNLYDAMSDPGKICAFEAEQRPKNLLTRFVVWIDRRLFDISQVLNIHMNTDCRLPIHDDEKR